MLNIADLIQTDRGRGVINILSADRLMQSPNMYATLLLWLLVRNCTKTCPKRATSTKAQAGVLLRRAHLLLPTRPMRWWKKIEQVVG